jgi:uncharacterized protein (DUF2147 family)
MKLVQCLQVGLLRITASRVVCAAAVGALMVAALPARGGTPFGLWYAEGGAAQVEILRCGDRLCGRVAWLRSPLDEDGCELRDERNSDPALRDRPIVGIEILTGMVPGADDRTWAGGTIYDPVSGRTYRCTLQLDGENRLRLHGYVGLPLLGRTTTWIRVGSENRMCKR